MLKSGEIKQIARNKLSGNWPKAIAIAAIFTAITYALAYCGALVANSTENAPIINIGLRIVFAIVLLPLSFGLVSATVKLINGKKPEYTAIINDAILNASKSVGIFFRTLLKIIIPSILLIIITVTIFFAITNYIPFTWDTLGGYLLLILVMYIICALIVLFLSLPYVLAVYALANDNSLSSKDAILQSVSLMEGNRWNFIKLMISFIGWFVLIFLSTTLLSRFMPVMFKGIISAVGSIFIVPYIISSISVFYDELNDVKIVTATPETKVEESVEKSEEDTNN